MKSLNDLVGYKNLKIYQEEDWFRFSLESILLPNFATINLKDKKILDLCTGNAPIPLVLSTRTKAKIYGVELQKDIYQLGVDSVLYNKLDSQITLINDDVKNLKNLFENESFDVITVNPPYFKYSDNAIANLNDHKTIARHEKSLKLDDIIKIAKYLLKNNGRFAMVHRTERLVEILMVLRENGLVPKKMQFIYPDYGKESKLFMVEAVKNGRDALKLLSPLYVHNSNGSYRNEILKIFNRDNN